MIQSHIFLTQSFIDQIKISKFIADSFFNSSSKIKTNFELNTEQTETELERIWNHHTATSQIMTADFTGKEDFTDSLMSFYRDYNLPTLLFLGDLDKYSLPLQEGMLRLLEEPPQNLIIILYAQNKSQILATITSRCQFQSLSEKLIFANLNQNLLEKVKKNLPNISEFIKELTSNSQFTIPDLSKVEREEISFWLWQITVYLEKIYKQNPSEKIALTLEKVLQAQKLNNENLQKKFVLGWLKV